MITLIYLIAIIKQMYFLKNLNNKIAFTITCPFQNIVLSKHQEVSLNWCYVWVFSTIRHF